MAINDFIPQSFYKEEIIEGYRVTERMKKVWAVELDLLRELLNVCEKNNIHLCVFAGTLLGAIRHNGFIPWDDDLDVCLTREEYEKLCSIASNEFKEPYFFQTATTDPNYFIGYARLRNSDTTGIIKWNLGQEYNNGIYIDIFVLDGYIDNTKKLYKQVRERNFFYKICSIYNMDISSVDYQFKRTIYFVIKSILRNHYSYNTLVNRYNNVLKRYNYVSDNVTLLTHNLDFISRYWAKKDLLFDTVLHKFEMLEVPIPRQYDTILTNIYGDYMKYPSEEKRGTWHEDWLTFEPDIPYKKYICACKYKLGK